MVAAVTHAADPRGLLLFGPGAGGSPGRYQRIVDAAVSAGFTVVAPAHERFDGRRVTDDQMRERAVGLEAALGDVDRPGLPVVAAGHSAGAFAALCLAGARPWGRDGRRLDVPVEPRVSRLVLLAPTVGWFQGPGCLDGVTAPILALVGASDSVTPPASAEILGRAPGGVDIRRYDGVGHLDFMSDLPPGVAPTPGLDHVAFQERLAHDVAAALTLP